MKISNLHDVFFAEMLDSNYVTQRWVTLLCSKNYFRADVLIAVQAHELFILFGKGIANSKY